MVEQDQRNDQRNNQRRTQNPGGRFDESREGFANHPHFATDASASTGSGSSSTADAVKNEFADRFDRARGVFNRGVEQFRDSDVLNRMSEQARTNPWVQIGLAGIGGLILGYVVGKGSLGARLSDFAAATAEEEEEDLED